MKMEQLVIPSVRKDSVIAHQSYLAQVDLGGHVFFTIVVYKADGSFAQEEGPDLDMGDVVRMFEAPRQCHVVER